jgi:hypothetical protein
MRRKFLPLLAVLASLASRTYGQDPVMPAIIPSSPQTFDLCKAGMLSNSLYTGTAMLSVPLYDLALKNYTLKVGLQYSSNGIRSSDIPSYVGMGFNLLAGGCVTRIIRDEPDGVPENVPYGTFPDPSNHNSSLRYYLNQAADNYWDTEPDEYMYNVNGMSGRFFVDSSGVGHCIPANNLKITVDDNYGSKTITIITADGTIYDFGLAETTNTFQVYGYHTYSTSFSNETAWFLTNITTQTGEWIHFEYGLSHVTDAQGSYTLSYTPYASNSCGSSSCQPNINSGYNQLNHDTRYLVGITSSSGVEVALFYEQRPDYSTSHDYRLYNMTVRENLTGTLNTIRKYDFKYSNYAGGRYFLDTLDSKSIDGGTQVERYRFSYYHPEYNFGGVYSSEWDIFGYPHCFINYTYPYPVDYTHIDTAQTHSYYRSMGYTDTTDYPDPRWTAVGMLTQAIFPTGGYQSFTYEPNIIFDGHASGVISGGVRVKTLENYDPLSGTSSKKYYKYTSLADTTASSGFSSYWPFYSYSYDGGFVCGSVIQDCPSTLISSNSLTPYGTSKGSMVTYGSVIESDAPDWTNGGIEHIYNNDYSSSYTNVYSGSLFMPVPENIETNLNGAEVKTTFFKKNNTSLVTLKKAVNTFSADYRNQKLFYGYITRRRYKWPVEYNPPQYYEFDGFDVIGYHYNSFSYNLTKTVTTAYDEKGGNPVADSVQYEYGDSSVLLPTKITHKASDTATIITYNKYPLQMMSGTDIHYQMQQNRDMPGVLVESKTYRNGNLVAAQKTVFSDKFGGSIIVPEQVQTKQLPDTTNYKTRLHFYGYGIGGAPKEMAKENDVHQCYIYGYTSDTNVPDNLPIAEVTNAAAATVAYTSFEVGSKGGWTYSGTPQTNPASVTGNRCYALGAGNITRTIGAGTTYIITFWLKNNTGTASVNSSSATAVISKNGWTLYTKTISSTSAVTISGTGKIDELRLYPQGAMMRTMTYRPFIGISSECDINNRITYYDYDGFGRLMLVRDEDKKILKKNCYTYNGQTENCNIYGNVQKIDSFSRNNCGSGYITTSVRDTIKANTYYATTQAAADALAQADLDLNGQDYANTNGICTVGWYNVQKSGDFTKNDCGSGYIGVTATYTVPAGTYTSTTSQAAADALAQNDVNTNGQNWVNTNGYCDPLTTVYYTPHSYLSYHIYFTFTNTYTSEQYFFQTTPYASPYTSTALGQLPPGYYDIEIYNPYNYSYHYYDIGCYDYAYGYDYADAYSVYLDDYCNTIDLNY